MKGIPELIRLCRTCAPSGGYPRFVAPLPPSLTDSSLEDRQLSRSIQLAERRERVLAAMTEVFAMRGYQAATVGNLIAGATISMGNFYKEFEGKEDAFLKV